MYMRRNQFPRRRLPFSFEVPNPPSKAQSQDPPECKGVSVIEWLEKDGPASLRASIQHLERRLAATPRLVAGHAQLRKLKDMRLPKDKFDKAFRGILTAFPEMRLYSFPAGYRVLSVDKEIAQIRCKLARAKRNFEIWNRTGKPPAGAGFLRLCSTPEIPNRPLTMWTIRGYRANDSKLLQAQLSEIDLIAQGLARNPRTRTGMPVLTIIGGYAPGEDPKIADARAIAVNNAIIAALKRIDPALLQFVGFALTAEAWCSEVSIAMRERVPPKPNLRLNLPPDHPLVNPRSTIAPTGTPLPPAPPPAKSHGRSVQDLFRERVDGILRRHGVKNATIRKAIVDSAVFQSEEALRVAVDQAGVSSAQKKAIVESIRALSRGRAR